MRKMKKLNSIEDKTIVKLISFGLTLSEACVAKELSTTSSGKEIANKLFVCLKTFKFHCTNIYKKLEIKSRYQYMVWAHNNIYNK